MAHQYGVALRTAQVAAIQTTMAASGTTNMQLRIYSGAEPANCAAAEPPGLLATIILPASFLTSVAGVTTLAGTWSVAATGTGTAQSYRMYDMAGTPVCHVQGNVTTDLVLNNTSISAGQTVQVTSYAVTAGNA
jgi:hypothetical protein